LYFEAPIVRIIVERIHLKRDKTAIATGCPCPGVPKEAFMQNSGPVKVHCTIEERPEALVVHIEGELGLPPTTDIFQKEFIGVLARRPSLVILDLSKLLFLSSLGIGILLDAQHNVVRHGGKARVSGAPPAIKDVFERTRLVKAFTFFETIDEALAA
jgi:anti-anti-sigma factor